MTKVVILKTENDNFDNYSQLLIENNVEPIFIPTLDFKFINAEELKAKLLSKSSSYSGLIFTSPRSVTAVHSALEGSDLGDEWLSLHNYCIGPTTEKQVLALLRLHAKGAESGNANALADFISLDLKDTATPKPFLFPCSNLRQDILENKLKEHGHALEPIDAYETIPHRNLEQNLKDFVMSTQACPEYIVFFSPSGVDYCNKVFQDNDFKLENQKLIAIGPSTEKAIVRNGWSVYRTCEKPTPEALLKTLS